MQLPPRRSCVREVTRGCVQASTIYLILGGAMAKYDAIVIGSGQAGNPLSQDLADIGWNVALIERAQIGGTCINTGCTPTKTMVASSQVAHYVRHSGKWGIHTGETRVDMQEVIERKNRNVHDWRTG